MKTYHIFLFTALTIATLSLVSCAKEDTAKKTETGDARDKFAYTWTCSENSKQVGLTTFPVIITKTGTGSQVLIENFYNLGPAAKAIADISSDNLIIQPQLLSGNTVSGSGIFLTANQVNLAYVIDNGATTDSCTAVLTSPH